MMNAETAAYIMMSGGQSGNAVFRDMVERHIPIYTYEIDSHYKWTLGVWRPKDENFGQPDTAYGAFYPSSATFVESMDDGNMYKTVTKAPTISTSEIIVLYADDKPLYTCFNNVSIWSWSPVYTSVVYVTDSTTYKYLMYLSDSGATLDSVSDIEADIVPNGSYQYPFYGSYNGSYSYTVYHSHQLYRPADRQSVYEFPTIIKYGEREIMSSSVSRSPYGVVNIIPSNFYGIFSDKSPSELGDILDTVIAAQNQAMGFDVRLSEFIRPSD